MEVDVELLVRGPQCNSISLLSPRDNYRPGRKEPGSREEQQTSWLLHSYTVLTHTYLQAILPIHYFGHTSKHLHVPHFHIHSMYRQPSVFTLMAYGKFWLCFD